MRLSYLQQYRLVNIKASRYNQIRTYIYNDHVYYVENSRNIIRSLKIYLFISISEITWTSVRFL